MNKIDIARFRLPNTPVEEVRFEQPRDIQRVVVTFKGAAPGGVKLSYLRNTWPKSKMESFDADSRHDPLPFGWSPIDDHYNSPWQKATTQATKLTHRSVALTFSGLRKELGDADGAAEYDVTFRRTLAVRVEAPGRAEVKKVEVYTTSSPARRRLRVELDAGRKTPGKALTLSAYNAVLTGIDAAKGVSAGGCQVTLKPNRARSFRVGVEHLCPAHEYANDAGHVTFSLDHETFTISLASLDREGPIWFAEQGVYVADADDPTTFADYEAGLAGSKTVRERVAAHAEQTYQGAFGGQPHPHRVPCSVGCKNARQRFWIDPDGDIVLNIGNCIHWLLGKDSRRAGTTSDARFLFDMEAWQPVARFMDPAPTLIYNTHVQRDGIRLEQQTLAVPLEKPLDSPDLLGDDTIVGMVRFRFRNIGDRAATAELPIHYSPECGRSKWDPAALKLDKLSAAKGLIRSVRGRKSPLRCAYVSTMKSSATERGGVRFQQKLAPGRTCDLLLKIPFIPIDRLKELASLAGLDFEDSRAAVSAFWQQRGRQGAQLRTPVPQLNALHTAHLAYVDIADFRMPDDPAIINTSVGMSTYPNFSNEACMIVHELDERGLHEEARRRLAVWVKYQGTIGLRGNFSDHDGVYYGAGAYECGQSYCQHHGWVLWALAEHYFLTGDAAWLRGVADSILAGMDWVARQRRLTTEPLAHSRGWEHGFLPAGGLEDVTDYFYWLSTNALTWRGMDSAASALEAIGHARAAEMRKESRAFRRDLVKGFETMRQHTPLVRLRNGRWVPTYPSRLYLRGRDIGWIRETLEGSVYLLLAGLFDVSSKQADWILDDYQDNRYMSPPFGYAIDRERQTWFDRGGFCPQPNLLAGLLPHLQRDEPEVYTWMFFNAWCSCYREQINAMVEHPMPTLGYSNWAHPKTSDESNAVSWLRYLFVHARDDALHLGRAIPRAWFKDAEPIWLKGMATAFGKVSVRYECDSSAKRITLSADLSLRDRPAKTVAHFRHPDKRPIRSVTVNGRRGQSFDSAAGRVDLTGMRGKLRVEARF